LSRDLQLNCVISFFFRLYLVLHACAARFDVTDIVALFRFTFRELNRLEVSFEASHQAPEHLAVSEDACGVSAAILERTFYAAAHALLRARSPAFLGSTSKCQVQGRPRVVAPVHRRVLSQLPRCLHPLPVKDRRNNVCKREAAALALCPFQIFFSLFSSSVAEPQQKYSSSFFNQRLLHT
jgi:hypothetical protein